MPPSDRIAGVTAPLFSLRTRTDWGIGDIAGLPRAASWITQAGMSLLQILPVQELAGGETSPYGARTAFGIDPIYIAIDKIPDLDAAAIAEALGDDGARELERVRAATIVDYAAVRPLKTRVIAKAFSRFLEREWARGSDRARALERFYVREAAWLRDLCLYTALSESHNGWGWETWPAEERDRANTVVALAEMPDVKHPLGARILARAYAEWIARAQWAEARDGMRAVGVSLMGDLPFIVGSESADVWSARDLFRRDVSLGAPPDEFSPEDGQDWSLPAYDWAAADKNGLAFFHARASQAAKLYDCFRLDHVVGSFRQWLRKKPEKGFFDPCEEQAQRERGKKILEAMQTSAKPAKLIAEDLGVIPPFVRETMRAMSIPGYKVLPWEKDDRFVIVDPKGFATDSVASWSTHDTAPITSWWPDLKPWEREQIAGIAGIDPNADDAARTLPLFNMLQRSGSNLTLVQITELVGDKTRINLPATVGPHNWSYRLARPIEDLEEDQPMRHRMSQLKEIVHSSGRV